MDRRLLTLALACWPARGLLAREDGPRPRHKISAGKLFDALSARFPARFRFAGLLELQVSASRLLLLSARNKLGAALLTQVSGLQLPGEMEIAFAVRYEAADRSIRAHDPEILEVRWPGLPPEAIESLRSVLPAIGRHVGEVVLHKFSPGEFALADTMGLEPEAIRVVDDGLVIFFGARRGR